MRVLLGSFAFAGCLAFGGQGGGGQGGTCRTEYDYVIVGSGPSGSAAANVLSKDPNNRVLLLEEGGYAMYPDKGVQDIWKADAWFGLIFNQELEKGYMTTPQAGLNGRTGWLPRAKVTGGCASHNGMVFVRGSRAAYDKWGEVADGWSWEDLKPDWQTILDTFDVTVNDGVSDPTYPHLDLMMNMCESKGHTRNDDFNMIDAEHRGCNYRRHLATIQSDASPPWLKRNSAWESFVADVMKERENLDVMVNSRVNKVIFNGNRADGVEVEDPFSGAKVNIFAKKEVILSAGVYDTPKLLMLSGVGPKDHLESLGIEVIKNLPGVGGHMIDDSYCGLVGPLLKDQPTEANPWPKSMWGIGGIQLWGPADTPPPVAWNLNIKVEANFLDGNTYPNSTGKVGIQVDLEPLSLKSEGTVRLASTNPEDAPIIDGGYFTHPDDMAHYIEVFKQGVALWDNDRVREVTEGDSIYPPPSVDTDEEIEEFIRNNCGVTDFHPAGTARMGPDDSSDVVDNRLRVHGLQGLRVMDASVFPSLTHGNPAQPAMLVGLRGASLVLGEWS